MGARNAIPENFGYFSVEFGDTGIGFAKVIEDWASFPSYFGRVGFLPIFTDCIFKIVLNRLFGLTKYRNGHFEWEAS